MGGRWLPATKPVAFEWFREWFGPGLRKFRYFGAIRPASRRIEDQQVKQRGEQLMYAKLFPEMYTGSMVGAGCVVFAVWPYALANCDEEGLVELNPRLLAMVLGASVQEIEQAIDFLMRPDPDSRSKDEDGRRIVREGQFLHRIVNYEAYRAIRDKQDRREYQREWDRKNRPSGHKRAKATQSDAVRRSPTRSDGSDQSRGRSRSRESEARTRTKRSKAFVPPTVDEVAAYAASRGCPNFDAKRFIDHYAVADWHDAKGNPVRNWKQKFISVWEKDAGSKAAQQASPAPEPLDIGPDGLTGRDRAFQAMGVRP